MTDQKSLTITEALAEIRTIGKRLNSKREGVQKYLARLDALKDPHEKNGGSEVWIESERQSISDLEQRIVDLRRSIAAANAATELTIEGVTKTVADWLTWRREVAPGREMFLAQMLGVVQNVRTQAANKGVNVRSQAGIIQQSVSDVSPNDVIVNVSEAELVTERDRLQEILGKLDGLLSLTNATTTI